MICLVIALSLLVCLVRFIFRNELSINRCDMLRDTSPKHPDAITIYVLDNYGDHFNHDHMSFDVQLRKL